MYNALEFLRQFVRSILERIPAEITIALIVAGVFWLFKWIATGTAWFLANKWKEIAKVRPSDQFVCAVEVKIGQDESARLLSFNKTPSEMASKSKGLLTGCTKEKEF